MCRLPRRTPRFAASVSLPHNCRCNGLLLTKLIKPIGTPDIRPETLRSPICAVPTCPAMLRSPICVPIPPGAILTILICVPAYGRFVLWSQPSAIFVAALICVPSKFPAMLTPAAICRLSLKTFFPTKFSPEVSCNPEGRGPQNYLRQRLEIPGHFSCSR